MKRIPIILRTVIPFLLTAVLLAWLCAEPACGQLPGGRFTRVSAGEQPFVPVYALAQDTLGFVWLGTGSGLYRHDGIRGQRFAREEDNPGGICNEHINVLDYDRASGRLAVGTDRGFCIYDNAGGFVADTAVGPRHVKVVRRIGSELWVGTTDGLFLRRGIGAGGGTGRTSLVLPGIHVASSCATGDGLFFGSYGCVWWIDTGSVHEATRIDAGKGLSGNLVLALSGISEDFRASGGIFAAEGGLFVGTERGLHVLDIRSGSFSCLWNGGPVKNFLYLHGGGLAAGTDNGLLVLSPSGKLSVCRHEVGDSRSIPDNVVWATLLDDDGNLWVGTDHGAALTSLDEEYDFIGVARAGLAAGLDISSILCTDGHVFAAGMNGILDFADSGKCAVYKSDRGETGRRIAHNKVRALYGDGHSVFSASDAGLDRISDGRVTHWHMTESTGRYLSDWMYAVVEDSSGRLWTGTYDGGIFVVSKSRLPERGGEVLCDRHISSEDGLSGNIVFKLRSFGDKVAAVTDKGVDIIDTGTFGISRIAVPDSRRTLSLASDGRRLWVGTESGVYLLDGDGLVPVSGTSVSAQSLVFSDGFLWMADGNEIWRCDVSAQRWQPVRKFENQIFSLAAGSDMVYAGSVNGFYSVPKSSAPLQSHPDRIVITGLYLDNVPVVPGMEYSGRRILSSDMALTGRITLGRNQNSFALDFSSMKYPAPAGRFAWRLKGFHDEWQTGSADSRAVFLNVPPGKYSFEVCHLNPEGSPDSETGVLEIVILRPWYATPWAFLGYAVLLAALTAFAVHFRKVKHQLRIERAEREKAQSIAASTVSRTREFRETLSAIFGSRTSGGVIPGNAPGNVSWAVSGALPGEPVPGSPSGGFSSSADSKFMKEISDIVLRHLSDPDFSAAVLCEESRWPVKQVYRKIKQLTGLGIVEFIRDIRLSQAASLLEQGQLSVTEIMYKVGFTTPSYFSKCFKARYGLTPSEYHRGSKTSSPDSSS